MLCVKEREAGGGGGGQVSGRILPRAVPLGGDGEAGQGNSRSGDGGVGVVPRGLSALGWALMRGDSPVCRSF